MAANRTNLDTGYYNKPQGNVSGGGGSIDWYNEEIRKIDEGLAKYPDAFGPLKQINLDQRNRLIQERDSILNVDLEKKRLDRQKQLEEEEASRLAFAKGNRGRSSNPGSFATPSLEAILPFGQLGASSGKTLLGY